MGGGRQPLARRPLMVAVAQPMQTAPRSVPPGRERQARASWRVTALAYLLLLGLGYLLLTPVVTWGQRRLDDLRYSFPRTPQLDGFVGHGEGGGGPTHLVAPKLRGE